MTHIPLEVFKLHVFEGRLRTPLKPSHDSYSTWNLQTPFLYAESRPFGDDIFQSTPLKKEGLRKHVCSCVYYLKIHIKSKFLEGILTNLKGLFNHQTIN